MATPLDWSALQWCLDASVGVAYEAALLDGRAVLKSLENYSSYRSPRGQRCFLFDGVDDYIDCGNDSSFNAMVDNFTIAIRFVSNNPLNPQRLVSKRAGGTSFDCYISNPDIIGYYDGATTHESTGHVFLGAVRTIVWRMTTNNLSVYFDGNLVIGPATSQSTVTTEKLSIGAWNLPSGAGFFNGKMLSVSLFSRSLTDDEIAFYATGTGTDPGYGDVAQYHCNEESGANAYDSSGNGNHGTITNANLTTFHATDAGVTSNPANDVGYTGNLLADVILPRDESDPPRDVFGGALEFAGQTPFPISVASPVGTFDGIGSYVQLGDLRSLISTQASMAFRVKAAVQLPTVETQTGLAQFNTTTASSTHYPYTDNENYISILSPTTTRIQFTNVFDITKWHWLIVTCEAGTNNWKVYQDETLGGQETVAGPGLAANSRISNAGIYFFNGEMSEVALFDRVLSFADIQNIVSSGTLPNDAVAHWTFSEGDGTTVYNVVANANHGTVTNATIPAFWAARSDAARDWSIEYGGRMETTVFVPGLLDGSAAANGSPITLLPTHFGNPGSRLLFDNWTAPELAPLLLPAESTVGELLRNVAPTDQKYRSEENIVGTADGNAFADGDNLIFNTPAALTGQDLTDAIEYIGRVPAVLPPVNTVAPALDKITTTPGQTITTDNGTWDPDGDTFEYLWFRAPADQAPGEQINAFGKFDGTDDFVDITPIVDIVDADFSISFTLKDFSQIGWLISNNNGTGFLVAQTNPTTVEVGNTTGSVIYTNDPADQNDWLLTHDTAQTGFDRYVLYKNGVVVPPDSLNGTYAQPVGSIEMQIGKRSAGSNFIGVQGKDFGFWDAVKTPAEVAAKDPTNLVAYYAFDETSGTTVADSSGNGNDGTLSGDDGSTFWQSETANSYVASLDDAGFWVYCTVTATNAGGSASADSNYCSVAAFVAAWAGPSSFIVSRVTA